MAEKKYPLLKIASAAAAAGIFRTPLNMIIAHIIIIQTYG